MSGTYALGQFIRESKTRVLDKEVPVLSVTNSSGFKTQSDYFSKNVHSKNIQNYKYIHKGQFAYNPSRVNVGSIDLLSAYEEGALSPMYVVFETDRDLLLPEYMNYFTQTQAFRNMVKQNTAGTVRSSLSFDALARFKLYIPHVSEQQKVVNLLKKADDGLKIAGDITKHAELLKIGLMQGLFTKGIGHNRFIESEIGEIPSSWKTGGFIDLTDSNDKNAIKPGPFGSAIKKSSYVKHGYKVYGQEQVISANAFHGDYYIDENKYDELKAFKVQAGDILMSLVGTVGKVLVVPDNFEQGIINPRLIKISLDKSKADPIFVAYLLASRLVKEQLAKKSHGGTMNIVNKSIILSLKIPIIPLEEQKEIAACLQAVDKKIAVSQSLRAKHAEIKAGLMQDLLSGKVQV